MSVLFMFVSYEIEFFCTIYVYTRGWLDSKTIYRVFLLLSNHRLCLVFSIPGNHAFSIARRSAFAAWVPAGGPRIRRSGPIVPELFLYFHVLDYYCWDCDLLAGEIIMEHGVEYGALRSQYFVLSNAYDRLPNQACKLNRTSQ